MDDIRSRLLASLPLVLLIPACMQPPRPISTAAQTSTGFNAPLASLPELPATHRSTSPMFEVERSLGAQCTIFEQGEVGPPPLNMGAGHCLGLMPRNLAKALLAIGAINPQLGINTDHVATKRIHYRVVEGKGQRADIFASMDGHLIRSFEGTTPSEVVYAVWNGACTPAQGADACVDSPHRRLYRIDSQGRASDVTNALMLPMPRLDSRDMKDEKEHGGSGLVEDLSKLSLGSTTRWIVELDPERPVPADHPREFDGGLYVHHGFVVWNGTRFVSEQKLSRSQWPCMPTPPDQLPCTAWSDAKGDRFVSDSHTPAKGDLP